MERRYQSNQFPVPVKKKVEVWQLWDKLANCRVTFGPYAICKAAQQKKANQKNYKIIPNEG